MAYPEAKFCRVGDHGYYDAKKSIECPKCAREKENKLEAEITRLTQRTKELEEKHRWIPVSERLPEDWAKVNFIVECFLETGFYRKPLEIFYGKAGQYKQNKVSKWTLIPLLPDKEKPITLPKAAAEARKAGR